jgi:tetrapyrrole methylase family protein/MazG family protein
LFIQDSLNQFVTLINIIARLRAPDGCPWDREQTHTSLRESFLEECYELLEAIDQRDPTKLCEELGDLLLHIIFQIQIATEYGEFRIEDVCQMINKKLIRRHPHVFGSNKAKSLTDVAHNWEVCKQKEREEGISILASVPKQMPALAYSQEVQRRVARIGFDWENLSDVVDKLIEEVKEFKKAECKEHQEIEFGDIIFTLANFARHLDIDLESALRQSNQRFTNRFAYMEKDCYDKGIDINELSDNDQNILWEKAKTILD